MKGGREGRDLDAVALAKAVEALGAGEIMLNCIDNDGKNQVRLMRLNDRRRGIHASLGGVGRGHVSLIGAFACSASSLCAAPWWSVWQQLLWCSLKTPKP